MDHDSDANDAEQELSEAIKVYETFQEYVETYDDPSVCLDHLEEQLSEALQGSLTEAHENYLLSDAVPTTGEEVLKRTWQWYPDESDSDEPLSNAQQLPLAMRVTHFFKTVLGSGLHYLRLQTITPELLRFLGEVVSCEHTFYVDEEFDMSEEPVKVKTNSQYLIPSVDPFIRPHYLQLVEHWIEIGGLKALKQLLVDRTLDLPGNENTRVADTIEIIEAGCHCLSNSLEYVQADVRDQYTDAVDAVLKWIEALSPTDAKSADSRRLDRTFRSIHRLACQVVDHDSSADQSNVFFGWRAEQIQLNTTCMFLQCENMPKQVQGINLLCKYVTLLSKKSKSDGSKRHWLNKSDFLSWLRDNGVVELILRSGRHNEVVKRSNDLMIFLANEDALRAEDLDLLWAHSVNQHESSVKVVFDCLQTLVLSMNAKHCDYMFKKLVDMPRDEYNPARLKLIFGFSLYSLKRIQDAQSKNDSFVDMQENPELYTLPQYHYGVRLMWAAANEHEQPCAPAEIRQSALDKLQKFLQANFGRPFRRLYAHLCFASLCRAEAVGPALKLLKSIITSLPDQASVSEEQKTTIGDIPPTEGPVNLEVLRADDACLHRAALLSELYKQGSLLQLILSKTAMAADADRTRFLAELRGRLDFVTLILENSSFTFTTDDIDVLWDSVIQGADSVQRDVVFSWLVNFCPTIPSTPHMALAPEVASYIFEKKLHLIPATEFSEQTFRCFEHYFLFINHAAGHLSVAAGTGADDYTLHLDRTTFVGASLLWQSALLSPPGVFPTVSKFLNRLYTAPITASATDPATVAPEIVFVHTCMKHLEEAFVQYTNGQNGKFVDQVKRSYESLEKFLHQASQTSAHSANTGGSATPAITLESGSTVTISCEVFGKEPIPLVVSTNGTVKSVRDQLSQKLGVAPGLLRLFANSKELTQNSKKLSDTPVLQTRIMVVVMRVKKGKTSPVKPKPLPRRPNPSPQTTAACWTVLSQNKRYVDILLSLFRIPSLAERVWTLLLRLPVNSEIELMLGSPPKDLDWSTFLDFSQIFQFNYKVRMIDAWMFQGKCPSWESSRTSVQEQQQWLSSWISAFLASKGFLHICKCLLSVDVNLISTKQDASARSHSISMSEMERSAYRLALIYLMKIFVSFSFNALKRQHTFHFATQPNLTALFGILCWEIPHFDAMLKREVDIRSLAVKCFEISNALLHNPPASSQDPFIAELPAGETSTAAALIKAALDLLIFCSVSMDGTAIELMYLTEGEGVLSKGWLHLLESCLNCKDLIVGFCAVQGLRKLCCKHYQARHPSTSLLTLTLKYLLDNLGQNDWAPSIYFNLLHLLLQDVYGPVSQKQELVQVFFQVLDTLHAYVSTESNQQSLRSSRMPESGPPDHKLLGLLTCARTILSISPTLKAQATLPIQSDKLSNSTILNFWFDRLLFDSPSPETLVSYTKSPPEQHDKLGTVFPMCRTPDNRKAAYQMLRSIVQLNDSNWSALATKVSQSLTCVDYPYTWSFSAAAETRSVTGYAGLKNLGCTCYLNASLQQLFMIKPFRDGVLKARPYKYRMVEAQNQPDSKEEAPEQTAPQDDESTSSAVGQDGVDIDIWKWPQQTENGDASLQQVQIDQPAAYSLIDQGNFLGQLQRLMAFLASTHHKSYNPIEFTQVYKDFEGNPIDITEQMDANEFLNTLFDKIDETLKHSPFRNILKNSIGGTIRHEVKCQVCGSVSGRDEPFYTISLESKGMSSIHRSLEAYVKGEVLSGNNAYRCVECKDKVTAVKSSRLKQIPDTLIVHLKRFEFNYDVMQKFKVNDECKFPPIIDLRPYTCDGVDESSPDGCGDDSVGSSNSPGSAAEQEERKHTGSDTSQDLFELCGVVVHTGSAEAGHYYSYIRERVDKERKGMWFCFEDDTVTPFDPKTIPQRCFGGSSLKQVWDQQLNKKIFKNIPNLYSAYMLVYERVDPQDVVVTDSFETYSSLHAPATLDERTRDLDSSGALSPSNLSLQIWHSNLVLAKIAKWYDPATEDFLWNFVKAQIPVGLDFQHVYPVEWSQIHTMANAGLEISILYFFRVLCNSHEQSATTKWVDHIKSLLRGNLVSCTWVLWWLVDLPRNDPQDPNADPNAYVHESPLFRALIQCPRATTRVAVMEVVELALSEVLRHERQSLKAAIGKPEAEAEQFIRGCFSGRFLVFYQTMLVYASSCWAHLSEYFLLLKRIAQANFVERYVLLSNHVVAELIAFYMGRASPHFGEEKRYIPYSMGSSTRDPPFEDLVATISIMIRGCAVAGQAPAVTGTHAKTPYQEICGPILPLPDLDRKLFLNKHLFTKLLSKGNNAEAIGNMWSHWSWNNVEFTKSIVTVIIAEIDRQAAQNFGPYFAVLQKLLSIPDPLQEDRTSLILTSLLRVMRENTGCAQSTLTCINFLQQVSSMESCRRWMHHPEHVPHWAWIESYCCQNKVTL